jgi:hypothetical protein
MDVLQGGDLCPTGQQAGLVGGHDLAWTAPGSETGQLPLPSYDVPAYEVGAPYRATQVEWEDTNTIIPRPGSLPVTEAGGSEDARGGPWADAPQAPSPGWVPHASGHGTTLGG